MKRMEGSEASDHSWHVPALPTQYPTLSGTAFIPRAWAAEPQAISKSATNARMTRPVSLIESGLCQRPECPLSVESGHSAPGRPRDRPRVRYRPEAALSIPECVLVGTHRARP